MKVDLFFPPQWTPTHSYLSLPSLAAYLSKQGMRANQWDLNLEFYEYLLSPEVLNGCVRELLGQRILGFEKCRKGTEAWVRYVELCRAFEYAAVVAAKFRQAKSVLFSTLDFFNPRILKDAQDTLMLAMKICSLAYGVDISFTGLKVPAALNSMDNLLNYIRDNELNPFASFYDRRVIDRIKAKAPNVAGISIIGSSQLVPGLTLARMVKESLPDCHVTLGGPYLTQLSKKVSEYRHALSSVFDSLVLYEGEVTLLRLLESVDKGEDVHGVSNVLRLDGVEPFDLDNDAFLKGDEIPAPLFDEAFLDRYFAPYRIIPLLTSQGCYWGKCSFCTHGYSYRKNHRKKDPALVADELETLKESYACSHFVLNDECVGPGTMGQLCNQIQSKNLNVSLLCDCRCERQFTSELCRDMFRAGVRSIYYGIESGSNRVLRLMKKGTTKELNSAVLARMAEAGLDNNVMLFFGFPGETEEDASQTFDFVLKNREFIHAVSAGVFGLGVDSAIHRSLDEYGLEIVRGNGDGFSLYLPYRAKKGISAERAEEIRICFVNLLDRHELAASYHILDPRTYRFLYVSEQGRDNFLSIEWDHREGLR